MHLLPPRSVQNYAWDWPTAGSKRIRLYVDPGNLSTGEKGVELPNAIDMMAIGIQPPMKVPVSPAMTLFAA